MPERRQHRELPGPIPTIGQLAAATEWVWVYCVARLPTGADCAHRAALKLAVAIARYGADASSDRIRLDARCKACGGKGAVLQLPSWDGKIGGFQTYPADL